MTPETTKKCAHPNCTCNALEGTDYCGPQCEAMEETPDIDCKCAHPVCKGRIT
jgi:metallothionein